MEADVHDMVAMWKALRMVSPLLLMGIAGIGGLMTYYIREMSKSMQHISSVIIRHEMRFERHEERLNDHDDRFERIESK